MSESRNSSGWKACFGYMDVMARRKPVACGEGSEVLEGISEAGEGQWPEGFSYPRAEKAGDGAQRTTGGTGMAMVISRSNGMECLCCPLFDRCGTFTEMSRKYSGGHVAKLAKAASEILDKNRDSMLFRLFS